VIVEASVDAREIEVAVLGNDEPEASIPGEIRATQAFYDYDAKYLDEATELIIPAKLDADQTEAIRTTAIQAYQALEAEGMARVDFLLDRETGQFFVNELNSLPGFTSGSMYPKLWEATGRSYPALTRPRATRPSHKARDARSHDALGRQGPRIVCPRGIPRAELTTPTLATRGSNSQPGPRFRSSRGVEPGPLTPETSNLRFLLPPAFLLPC